MSDREMLELAAKAAGIDAEWDDDADLRAPAEGMYLKGERTPDSNAYWNPLTDDGDALRLAVKLGLHISQQLSYVAVMRPHGGPGSHLMQGSEQYGTDPYAATRRAIVRAAAEIGRRMP